MDDKKELTEAEEYWAHTSKLMQLCGAPSETIALCKFLCLSVWEYAQKSLMEHLGLPTQAPGVTLDSENPHNITPFGCSVHQASSQGEAKTPPYATNHLDDYPWADVKAPDQDEAGTSEANPYTRILSQAKRHDVDVSV